MKSFEKFKSAAITTQLAKNIKGGKKYNCVNDSGESETVRARNDERLIKKIDRRGDIVYCDA